MKLYILHRKTNKHIIPSVRDGILILFWKDLLAVTVPVIHHIPSHITAFLDCRFDAQQFSVRLGDHNIFSESDDFISNPQTYR